MNKKEINELKIFLKKVLLFSVLMGMILVMVMLFVPFEEDNYYLAIVDKHKALETTPQPRIILVGGSNVAFGIDSEKIEHELHLSVVNTGLYAGVGLPYMLSDLKPYLKDGDIIIIIPEYSQFFDEKDKGEVEPLAAMIGINPLSILYLHPKSMREIHLIGATLFRHKANFALDAAESFLLSIADSHDPREDAIKDDKIFSYSRQGFNQYGDEVSHWNYSVQYDEDYETGPYLGNKINYDQIELLNEFHHYAEKRNISVYLSFSPIDQNEYQKNQTAYNQFYHTLKGNVALPLLGTIEEFSFPRAFFFDTKDHLNYEGVENRTEKLIFEIKKINPDVLNQGDRYA